MKLTAEQILALPIFEVEYREFKCQCGNAIRIPHFPEVRTSPYTEDSVVIAVDSNFVSWMPVATERGLMRQRL